MSSSLKLYCKRTKYCYKSENSLKIIYKYN